MQSLHNISLSDLFNVVWKLATLKAENRRRQQRSLCGKKANWRFGLDAEVQAFNCRTIVELGKQTTTSKMYFSWMVYLVQYALLGFMYLSQDTYLFVGHKYKKITKQPKVWYIMILRQLFFWGKFPSPSELCLATHTA